MCRCAGIIFLQIILLPIFLCLAEDELIFVNVLYRHGDRTPVNPYPTDPYKNISFWPTGFGQLTNHFILCVFSIKSHIDIKILSQRMKKFFKTGKQQHFQLGQWLRKRYSGFLPVKYSLDDIYVRSTDVDRTLMSAESHLAGLYAPVDTDVWNPDLKWQPIPVHTIPEKSDAILSGKQSCARYKMEKEKVMHSAEIRRINAQLEPLYKYATNHSGKVINSLQEIEYLYNTLFIEHLYKLTLPPWTAEIFPEKLTPWAHVSFEIDCYTTNMQRLKVGLLINEVFTRMRNKTVHRLEPDRKMWMYSAHDTTIANVLMAFGAFEPHCPPYRSMILLELRHSDSLGYYVSAFYKNDTTTSSPRSISIKGCPLQCPLDRVFQLLAPIMLTYNEWESECRTLAPPLVSTIAAVAVVSCGVLLLLLLTSLCLGAACSKQQQNRNQFYQPLNDEIN